MADDVAVVGAAQVAFEVITTVTLFPLASVVLVKVAPIAPTTGVAPINHW
jgi:hypothetical protein